MVVRADGDKLEKALNIYTSEGFRVIRNIFLPPIENKLSPFLVKIINGELNIDEIEGIVLNSEGKIVVLIYPFIDGNELETMNKINKILTKAPKELSQSYENAYVIDISQIIYVLNSIKEISLITPLSIGGLSLNIAVKPDILNITPLWDLNYNGENIIILHNDYGIETAHPDFKLNNDDTVVLLTAGDMDGAAENPTHGTHTAGILVGQGSAKDSDNSGFKENQCLCKVRPEERLISDPIQNYCGDLIEPLSDIKGVAFKAKIISNNFNFWEGNDNGFKNIKEVMNWGSQNGAKLSTNSFWKEENLKGLDNCNFFGDYEGGAQEADQAVRDANYSTPNTNEEMTIVFSAGNNDGGENPCLYVKCPGNAKNIISVGATENARCGESIEHKVDENNVAVPPDPSWVIDISGRGPSQGRIKPDLVATGAEVLSLQSSFAETLTPSYNIHECWDCRNYCPEIPNENICKGIDIQYRGVEYRSRWNKTSFDWEKMAC